MPTAISNSSSGSIKNISSNLTNVSNPKKINYGRLAGIIIGFIIIAFVIAPLIGYHVSENKKGGLIIGITIGIAIILLLWLLFGRLLI